MASLKQSRRELDRLASAATDAAKRTPTIVLDAFLPGTELVITLTDILRMERIGSPLVSGGTVRVADILTAWAVLTDWPGVQKAHRKGSLADYLDVLGGQIPPANLQTIAERLASAIAAALAPASIESDGDTCEKKSPRAADGGSPSSSSAPPATAGG